MSILDDIRNRNAQPTVEPRADILQDSTPVTDTTTPQVEQPGEVSELKRLEELLASFPEIAARIPVRLETPIKDELDELCNREKITIETLLEAFYVTCKDKDSTMRQVVKEAKKRLKSRKEAGNIRSSLTKLNNLTTRKR
ncbi:KilA domain protein (plasmid) [Calothrix sp. NIES-4071]|nr:KilA domain protein [Calothrix sp. NIES-4071]BAZ65121.1 KilA domain protein [Calothrix sp. NIES-4105]